MMSHPMAASTEDVGQLRQKNKFSFNGLRQQLLSSFRPSTSPTSERPAHNSLLSLPPRPQTVPETLSQYCSSSDTISETLFNGRHTPVSGEQKATMVYLSPQTKDFAYQSTNSDSASAYSDAIGEPLVNDASSDYIPRSVRPLIGGTIDAAPQNGSVTPRRNSKLGQGYHNQPHTPESVRHRLDSIQSKPEDHHRRREASIDSILSTQITNSPRAVSSAESLRSTNSSDTAPSTHHDLPPLQHRSLLDEADRLDPVLEDDPKSFDLVEPGTGEAKTFQLVKRIDIMLSHGHLAEIFADPASMLKFTSFLSQHRPQSIPLLIYYLDALKSIKAIQYANAIAEALAPIKGLTFTNTSVDKTINSALEQRAQEAFNALVKEDLPAYVSYVFIQVVNLSLRGRVSGTMPAHLREASEGLAEVFCLTDPSRHDNPIVFASEEFHRTTQYGVDYAIGRNCRFLQGPNTSKAAISRLKQACLNGKETVEIFLNYRRDGSPFMNLLMMAPLIDSRGKIRYFIGAQVDVSGLCKDCTDLEALRRLLDKEKDSESGVEKKEADAETQRPARHGRRNSVDEFQELSEMLNDSELDVVRRHGGRMHPSGSEEVEDAIIPHRPRILVRDSSQDSEGNRKPDVEHTPSFYPSPTYGRLMHVYQNYLLVRPYPSLRILFASAALRTPGILQSPFLSRIGGSSRVREELQAALAAGRGVTAKVRWVNGRSSDDDGRPRWVHCTPLLGKNGAAGVWMVVIVDEEGFVIGKQGFKTAPPVSHLIGSRSRTQSRATSIYGSDGDDQSLRAVI